MTFYLVSTSFCLIVVLIFQTYMAKTPEKVAIITEYAIRNNIERDFRKIIVLLVPIINIIVALGLLSFIFMSVESLKKFMEDL